MLKIKDSKGKTIAVLKDEESEPDFIKEEEDIEEEESDE